MNASLNRLLAASSCLVACCAGAAPDPDHLLEQLASCQSSWWEWQQGVASGPHPAADLDAYWRDNFHAGREPGSLEPNRPVLAFGAPVSIVWPNSVGMSVGFTLAFDSPFAQLRVGYERALGRALECKTRHGQPQCKLELGERKTALLTVDSGFTVAACLYGHRM